MNVFVLCAGRCGSYTFARAASHATNYSAGHETQCDRIGGMRVLYPTRHIEVDNRLSWFLGSLDKVYGDEAFYVHLQRNADATARSFLKLMDTGGIISAYANVIRYRSDAPPIEVCREYCTTVHNNIELFLRDKTNTMSFQMELWEVQFPEFWERIQAQGDLAAALAEWEIRHNASDDRVMVSPTTT